MDVPSPEPPGPPFGNKRVQHALGLILCGEGKEMLSAGARALPVRNYSTKIISDAAGSTFDPVSNSRVRINVPASVAMIDPHNSYIQCDMRVIPPAQAGTAAAAGVNTFKMRLSNDTGAEQIIRNLRVTLDQQECETIQNCNVLEQFIRAYDEDASSKGIEAVFNHTSGYVTGGNPTPFVETYNAATGFMTCNNIATRQVLRPKCSGLLGSKTGIPLFLTGAMAIEWDLETSANVLTPEASGVNAFVPCDNINATNPGGEIGGNGNELEVTFVNAAVPRYRGYKWGYSDAETLAGCPFAVGNVVTISLENATLGAGTHTFHRTIAALTQAAGKLKIELDTAIGGLGAGVAATAVQIQAKFGYSGVTGVGASTDAGVLTASTQSYTYEISNVAYVARVIEAPPQYLAGAMRKIAEDGGFQMDVLTWGNYVNNVLENVSVQSHLVPAYMSRVKSVVSIPVSTTQTEYFSNRGGSVGNTSRYQSVLGTRREPQRPVQIDNWTSDTTRQYPSQEHLHELAKALAAAGISIRSLRQFRTNFAMCRALSYQGSSESLADKGYRLEMQHLSNVVSPKTLQSFVHSIRRLVVSRDAGLQVLS